MIKSFQIKVAFIAALIAFSTASAQVSEKCRKEVADIPGKLNDFNLVKFATDWPIAKGKCMLPIGCDPKSVGLSKECAKELPLDPRPWVIYLLPGYMEKLLGIPIPKSVDELKSQLKGLIVDWGAKKAADVLKVDACEIPRDIKGMEGFLSSEAKKKAKALGFKESDIKEQAKKKIASSLKMKPADVKLSSSALKEYVKKDKCLAPVASTVQVADISEILSIVNLACDFLQCADSAPPACESKASDEDELDDYSDDDGDDECGDDKKEEKLEKKKPKKDYDEEEEEEEKPKKKKTESKDESWVVGLRFGANNSKADIPSFDDPCGGLSSGCHYNAEIYYKTGLQGGIVLNYGYFQTGLMLIQRGVIYEESVNFDYLGLSGSMYSKQDISLYFLELPVQFSYKIPVNENVTINADIGGYIAFGLKKYNESTFDPRGIFDTPDVWEEFRELEREAANTEFRGSDYGLSVGGGVEYDKFFIGIFYDYGLRESYEGAKFYSIGANLGYNF